MKEFRPAIIRMHENGYSVREIAEILSVPKSTVHDDSKLMMLKSSWVNFQISFLEMNGQQIRLI